MVSEVKQRNQSVDILRGIAMLFVVLQHTILICTVNFEKTFLYNMLWSLQMPLFFLISGYVTRYSREISNSRVFGKFIIRRTVSYMLPFLVWTFVVRGFVFRQVWFFDIKMLVYNMDTGYWFLFSIYLITIILGISEYISNKINKSNKQFRGIIITSVLFVIGAVGLLVMGLLMGLNFLCIKLTLYYMPFYLAGFIFGKLQDTLLELKYYVKIKEIIVAVCLFVYVFLVAKYCLFTIDENLFGIIIRYTSSILGCVVLCSLVSKFCSNKQTKTTSALKWVGEHSLEVYVAHYLVLNIFRFEQAVPFLSPKGSLLVLGNFIVTIIAVVLIIKLLSQNKILQKVLFGKGK